MFPNWNNKNQTPAAPTAAAAASTPTPTYSYGYAHHQQQAFTQPVVTPEQQLAIQQWQAYQQQYAQWHAMYGEAYQRELQAQQQVQAAVAVLPIQPPLPYGNPVPPPPPADPPSDAKPPEPPAEGGVTEAKAPPQPVKGLGYDSVTISQPPRNMPPDVISNNRFGNQAMDGNQSNWNRGNWQNRGSNSNSINNNRGNNQNRGQNQPQSDIPSLIDWGGQNANSRDSNRDQTGRGGSRGGRGNNSSDNRGGRNNSFDENRNIWNNNRGNRGRNNNNYNNNNTNSNIWRGNDRWNNNNSNNNNGNNRPNLNPWQNNDEEESVERQQPMNFRNENRWNDDHADDYRDNQDARWSQGDRQEKEPTPPINPDEKTPEELAFDLQFQKWETDFEAWKKANVNHPDRVAYREYEMKFEECRVKLVERREQMKRKKLEAMLKMPPPVLEPLKPPPPAPIQVEDEKIDEPLADTGPPKQWSYTNSFFNSSAGSSGGIPGLDFADGGEAPTIKEEEKKKPDAGVPIIDLVADEVPPKPVETVKAASNSMPDMSEISKNVNNLLGNQQLMSLLSSINNPVNVQATVAAVAPLLSVLSKINTGDVQKQLAIHLPHTQPVQEAPPPVFNLQHPPPLVPQGADFGPNRHSGGNFNLNRSAFDFGDDNANGPNFVDFDDRGQNNRNFGGGRMSGGGGGGFQNRNYDDSRSQHSNQSYGNNRFNQYGAQNFDERSQNSAHGYNNDYNNEYDDEEDNDASRFQDDEYQDEEPPPHEQDQDHYQQNPNFGDRSFERNNMRFGGPNVQNTNFNRNEQPVQAEQPAKSTGPPRFNSVMEEFEYYRNLEQNKTVSELGASQDGFNRKRDHSGTPKSSGEDYFRPATVIDYQNRSSISGVKSSFQDILLPTKVVDYGHRKPVASKLLAGYLNPPMVATEVVPEQEQEEQEQGQMDSAESLSTMPTIDYGHMRPHFQKSLKRKKNANKRLKRYQKVASNLIVESNATYPSKWVLINDTRDMSLLRTKRGKRKRRNGELFVKKRMATKTLPTVAMKLEGEEISDTEIGDEPELPASKVPIHFMHDEDALDNITSGSDNDMDLESDEDDDKLYVKIGDLLLLPHRSQRPKKILIVMRGPPGSGKSHLAKLIKDKECEMGGSLPRILCLDDYFMVETEEIAKCPDTGRRVVVKNMVYEYEQEMESNYMKFLMKSFKKTVCDGLHNFIIVDCVNESLDLYNEFCAFGAANGFRVYTCDLPRDLNTCLKHNIHKRDAATIERMIGDWAPTPDSNILLNCKILYKKEKTKSGKEKVVVPDIGATAKDTQASDVSDEDFAENNDDDDDASKSGFFSSKWDADTSEQNLARLDGISKPLRPATTIEDYLQLDGWEPSQQPSKPGQKRVRWADIEEKRQQQKMRAIGFVVGSTNWDRMMDTTDGASALVKTKYIDRVRKN